MPQNTCCSISESVSLTVFASVLSFNIVMVKATGVTDHVFEIGKGLLSVQGRTRIRSTSGNTIPN